MARAPTARDHLEVGKSFARQGQSVRAEQYYLAALALGADERDVFFLVVDTCIQSGRLGSAMRYVDERLRADPENPEILQLAASLREALGHTRQAWGYVVRLERIDRPSPQQLLYLAEFYERQGDAPEKSLRLYVGYRDAVPVDEREPWVDAAVRRLKREIDQSKAANLTENSHEN